MLLMKTEIRSWENSTILVRYSTKDSLEIVLKVYLAKELAISAFLRPKEVQEERRFLCNWIKLISMRSGEQQKLGKPLL